VQVFFKDGTHTARVAVDFPIGHRKRRAEGVPLLVEKFAASVTEHFTSRQAESIKAMFGDRAKLAGMTVSDFVARLVKN
jgi:2-methylcitrate dehydratase